MGSPGLPAAPGGYAPAAPAGGQAPAVSTYTRTRTVEGAVYLMPGEADVPLPAIGGFAVTLALHPASPTPSPGASGQARALAAAALPLGSPGAATSPLPSGNPSSTPSAGPSPVPNGSAAGSGSSAGAAATASPSGAPRHPSPMPSGPKIETKTTIYPSDAPAAPSPAPTGNVQTFFHQSAIVRGYLLPATDLTLSSLDAVRFTIPKDEQTPNRGFVIALYDVSRKHKDHLIAFGADTSLSNGVVSTTGETDALKLTKGSAYAVVLYGDDLPATPPPSAAPVIPPATNPYASPPPSYPPGYAPPGYQPQGATYPPGYPAATPYNPAPH